MLSTSMLRDMNRIHHDMSTIFGDFAPTDAFADFDAIFDRPFLSRHRHRRGRRSTPVEEETMKLPEIVRENAQLKKELEAYKQLLAAHPTIAPPTVTDSASTAATTNSTDAAPSAATPAPSTNKPVPFLARKRTPPAAPRRISPLALWDELLSLTPFEEDLGDAEPWFMSPVSSLTAAFNNFPSLFALPTADGNSTAVASPLANLPTPPKLEVVERDGQMVVRAASVSPSELEVSLDPRRHTLTIRGQTTKTSQGDADKETGSKWTETSSWVRTFRVHDGVSPSDVKATQLADGVVEVSFPSQPGADVAALAPVSIPVSIPISTPVSSPVQAEAAEVIPEGGEDSEDGEEEVDGDALLAMLTREAAGEEETSQEHI